MTEPQARGRDVTPGTVLRLWAPLEAAWLLMAAEGPFVAATIARMDRPEPNLAAFGVALGLAMLFESPIILIMSASAALVENRHALVRLRNFTYALNGAVTLALAVFVCPPVFRWATGPVMGLPPEVAGLCHRACVFLLPWPAAIGYRRFHQGILVRHGLTRRIAYGTVLRLGTMGCVAVLLAALTAMPGAWVGGAALATGVVVEAAASRYWARGPLRLLRNQAPTAAYRKAPLDTRGILRFYAPLAVTSVLTLGVNPMVAFFLGRSRLPLESLAVMPVVGGLIFAFNTAGLAFQEVAITLFSQARACGRVLNAFALWLGLASAGALVLAVATPLLGLWLTRVAGLGPGLVHWAWLPMLIAIPLPAITVATSLQRAVLVVGRRTGPISWGTAVEVAGIAGTLLLLTRVLDWVGAVAAVTAMVAGRGAAMLYLLPWAVGAGRVESRN